MFTAKKACETFPAAVWGFPLKTLKKSPFGGAGNGPHVFGPSVWASWLDELPVIDIHAL